MPGKSILDSGGYQAAGVSVPAYGRGPKIAGYQYVPQSTATMISENHEEGDNDSFLETIEEDVPVRVRDRPNIPDPTSFTPIGDGDSQHGGSGSRYSPARKAVPGDSTIMNPPPPLRNGTSMPTAESVIQFEEDVPVRKRPTGSSVYGAPRHDVEDPPVEDGPSTDEGTSKNKETSTSNENPYGNLLYNFQPYSPPGYRTIPLHGVEKWTDADDVRIWKDIRAKVYQGNLVELISPQRPGPLGYVDKVTESMTNQQNNNLTDADFGYRIHFADLQRIQIQYLHSKLVNLAVSAHFNADAWKPGGKAEEIGKTMKEYIQAVRDHEYMGKYTKTSNDPFIATSQRLYDKRFLEAAMTAAGDKMPQDFLPPLPPPPPPPLPPMPLRPNYELPQHEQDLIKHAEMPTKPPPPIPTLVERLQKHAAPTGPWEVDNPSASSKPASALVSTRTKAWKRAYWTRIGAAVIGGAFLIAPMWILALQRNLYVHLGVATGCIGAFGVSMSLYLETVDNVFAATLAYAAVIMVFVGIVIEESV
ncbi:hypothetical protein B0T20DRAFT_405159 [Sordaria brevicollis]|uniref:DUF6594 domain-containing protein n=1 Tax=Sordaria brevicollis TaxID=83679 RepID=A0AAE0PJ22_SORBR|nr:hypothetical protein B0T20DRAFT_405159 [Sordaria brevicollis]